MGEHPQKGTFKNAHTRMSDAFGLTIYDEDSEVYMMKNLRPWTREKGSRFPDSSDG